MRTIQEQLIQNGLAKKTNLEMAKSKVIKETLSKKEIEELMGCNMPTYKRVNGAIKRKR